jgi:hypothetical protein
MKAKYFRAIIIGLMIILLVNTIFFAVPASPAQSSQTWSNPINLSSAGSSTIPASVIDAAGVIHVVWFDQFDGYKYTASTDGIDWSVPIAKQFPFSSFSPVSVENSSPPVVPVFYGDKNGGIYAFWLDKKNALYYSKASSGFEGASGWTGATKLAESVLDFDIVVSPGGILHVSYVSSLGADSGSAGVYYLKLKANTWSKPKNLYSSQYFRPLKPDDANVHLAVSDENETETVYMVWDDRPQKRVLLSKSLDGGNQWEDAVKIRDSEDSSGLETPYNINISVVGNEVLLLWQYGQPGSQCTQYSQVSRDGAKQFEPPEKMLAEFVGCPQATEFIGVNRDFTIVSLNILDDIAFVAWNGSRWSKVETQTEISTFINPVTYDSVILSCKNVSSYNEHLFVVGCDKGSGSDIWFSSRTFGAISDWFPPESAWTTPVEVANTDQQISELSSVSDIENNIHIFWVQSIGLVGSGTNTAIQYARWNSEGWSNPESIISSLDGRPLHLKAVCDNQNRLMLTWVDSKTGDMLFSWASANRANIATEWETPQYIPSASQANSSPSILVDASGKIIIAYAIPINEKRGIYFVESGSDGTTWTQPIQIFDATSAGWDIVDQPEISLTGDGRLHLLFKRYSTQGEPRQSLGLYYSQSANGGTTWSNPETVSEQSIPWSELVAYDKSTLFRLWQEYRQATLVSFHQISLDAGLTWSRPLIVSSIDAKTTSLTGETMDRAGNLYFFQLTGKDNLTLLGHVWNGSSWISQESKELYIQDGGVPVSTTVGVSSKGNLLVSVLASYPYMSDKYNNNIISLSKYLGLSEEVPTPYPAVIAMAESTLAPTEDISDILQSPTQVPSVKDINNLSSSLIKNKNLIGLLFLSGIIFLIIFIFRPIGLKKNGRSKRSD